MSYNIRYDNNWDVKNSWSIRKKKVIQIFDQYEPSIIGVQEGLLNQVQYIDSCLANYDYVGVGREDGKERGEFCVIYFDTTRYTVSRHSTFWLSETPDTISVGWDAALERICTYGLFKDKKTADEFWVFNTHFDHMGSVARERSSGLILDRINEVNHRSLPVILMGDFNSDPDSPPINKIRTEMSDALQLSLEKLQGPIGTFNGFDPDLPIERRIDYVFTRDVKVLSYTHVNDRMNNNRHISDHLPVIIKIR
tara:strand:+ start:283 stop:1038 length:756 start_codon:yes stop_codon:yes gene_type:complete